MPQVVESDRPQVGSATERVEMAGEGGGFDRVPVGPGEDKAVVHPLCADSLLLVGLPEDSQPLPKMAWWR